MFRPPVHRAAPPAHRRRLANRLLPIFIAGLGGGTSFIAAAEELVPATPADEFHYESFRQRVPYDLHAWNGYFEDFAEGELATFRDRVDRPLADYEPTEAVLLAPESITAAPGLPRAIIDAGARVLVVVEHAPDADQQSVLTRVRGILEATIADAMHQVEFVKHPSTWAQGTRDFQVIWKRDSAPLWVRTHDDARVLVDYNRSQQGEASLDEHEAKLLAGYYGLERLSLPVMAKGGAFLATGRGDCFTTSEIFNHTIFNVPDVQARSEVASLYLDYLGCERLEVFQSLAYDPGGAIDHVDFFAIPLDDDTVAVADVHPQSIADANRPEFTRHYGEDVATFLRDDIRASKALYDFNAEKIAALGYRVIRWPIPGPHTYRALHYANVLIVNDTLIVPRYRKDEDGRPFWDTDTLAQIEADIERAVAGYNNTPGVARRYRVVFVDADQLLGSGGSLHCISSNLHLPASGGSAAR